ncbi:hypothetical protein, partial [Corynebacterium belfantii]|uniref:hypothetical protein n=1 Tax=Corynebacterium belfantii TaxID=2014537 RepID=UPI001A7EF5EA
MIWTPRHTRNHLDLRGSVHHAFRRGDAALHIRDLALHRTESGVLTKPRGEIGCAELTLQLTGKIGKRFF